MGLMTYFVLGLKSMRVMIIWPTLAIPDTLKTCFWYNMYKGGLMIQRELNISQARRLLPSLVHALDKNPEYIFRITLRDRLVAELKAPAQIAKRGLAAARLLQLARKTPSRSKAGLRVSENTDRYLFE